MSDQNINTECVSVSLQDRSYDILIGRGLMKDAGTEIAKRLPNAKATVITDETVAENYLAPLTESLKSVGIEIDPLVLKPGEAKRW
jgi:3-dehydroquinate synthase